MKLEGIESSDTDEMRSMMQIIAESAQRKTPYLKKIVVDFIREAGTASKCNVLLQIKYVELDYVVAKYDGARAKLPPLTKELTRCKTDFVLNSKPLMEKAMPKQEPPQAILNAVDIKGQPIKVSCPGDYCKM